MGTSGSKPPGQEVHRVTRIWKVPHDPASTQLAPHPVQERFRRGMLQPATSWVVLRQEDLGLCRVYVDGVDTLSFVLSPEAEEASSGVVALPDGHKAGIWVRQNQSWVDRSWKFGHVLHVDGRLIPELNDFHHQPPHSKEQQPQFIASVTSHKKLKTAQGDEYVCFEISVAREGEATRVIQRRYRDFCMLDMCVRWSWIHHPHFSLDTLPRVPERRVKNVGSRMDERFLETRQQKLEIYIKQVLKLPRSHENPDILAFFGFVASLDDIAFYADDGQKPHDPKSSESRSTVNEQLTAEAAAASKAAVINAIPMDDFDKMLIAVDQEQIDKICSGSSKCSQDYMNKLALDASVETIFQGIFKVNKVKTLVRGFNAVRRDKDVFNEAEFQDWCDSHLPLIADVLKDRVQLLCKQITPKRPFPPQLDNKSILIDDSALRFLSVAFTEGYGALVWNRLFASFTDGLSFQAICTAVEGYEGPTMIVIQDSFGCRFGALATARWREETAFFTSSSGALFSVDPVFRVYRRRPVTSKPQSKNAQYMNSRSRTLPLGMGFGGELHAKTASETAPHPRLWIDAEFDTCFASSGSNDAVYEPGPLLGDDLLRETFRVAQIEVWGLGGIDGMKSRDAWRAQKERMLLKQRQVDKSQFANNAFDREYLLNGTFSGSKRETNDN